MSVIMATPLRVDGVLKPSVRVPTRSVPALGTARSSLLRCGARPLIGRQAQVGLNKKATLPSRLLLPLFPVH